MPSHRPLLRIALAGGLVALVLVGQASAADSPAPITMPTPGCVTFSDPSGDAAPPWGNDPDLDITWAAFTSPAGKIRVFIHLDGLGSPTLIGHVYDAAFTFRGKEVRIIGGEDASGFDSIPRDPLGLPLDEVTYDASPIAGAVPDVVFDTAKSVVILTADRAPIEKAAGGPLADGITVSGVAVHASGDGYVSRVDADTAPTTVAPAQSVYAIGDNHCLVPPKAALSLTVPAHVVYGHAFTITGRLAEQVSDKDAVGKKVSVSIGGVSVDITTDDGGALSRPVAGTLLAGGYGVTASWAGDDTLQKVSAAAHTDIALAPTSLTLSSTTSGSQVAVKTILLSDQKQALAGQTVTWFVDGKAVKTTKSDATGKCTFATTAKHTVKASFGGAAGRYLASSATKKT